MAWLVVFLLCLGQASGQFLGDSTESDPDLEEELLHLLLKLDQEEAYDTLLVYGKSCVFHSISRRLDVPTVLVSSGSTHFDWGFSSLALILSCGPEDECEANYRTLLKLQRNRRIVYLPLDFDHDSVCETYFRREQYNVAMIRADFDNTKLIYACRFLPHPRIEEIDVMEAKSIYIEPFQNMHGMQIKAVTDLLAPRSMMYLDPRSGERKLTGYVANLFNTFAQSVNATLQFETLGRNLPYKEIKRRISEDELDIGIFLEGSVLVTNGLDTASYPFLLTTYCLMLPVPSKLPFNRVYAIIVDPLVLGIIFVIFCLHSGLLIYSRKMSWRNLSISNVLVNDITLRGLLGQSFPFPSNANKQLRMIFCILCFASIMLTTMYDAYLQSFFTDPPTDHEIRSFEDIGRFHQKIAIPALEVHSLVIVNNSQFGELNKEDLLVISNWKDYLNLRDSLNVRFGYPVTEDRWSVYAEQQKLFKKPVFYFAKDLCFSRQLFMSIPLRRFLPYRHLFEDHIRRQQEFGLVNYWKSHSFFDMVGLGITPLSDLSPQVELDKSLLLQDVSWIFKIYLVAMVISVVCFLIELLSKVEIWKMCFRKIIK
ncbi:uncharacterized protein LOC108101794 [Drosophila ficusphila]|uniref:uncharacterized protein LOC108101794 n=1 Tax=Drosophila ficusphila TaxID=30025 RepID=UPI0007E6194E|nr:uncharacterized protein LOC108101794 [Drosophila ficusphila]